MAFVQKGQIETLPETIYGFTCLQATDKFIFATLHGVANPTVFPSSVYMFDWGGRLLKKHLQINKFIAFCV